MGCVWFLCVLRGVWFVVCQSPQRSRTNNEQLDVREDMHDQRFFVPPFATTQLLRASCEAGRSVEILDMVEKAGMTLSPDAVVVLVEDCGRRSDVSSAKRVEELCRKHSVQLLGGAYDGLLKLYTLAGDTHALELFKAMQASGTRITEGLCVGLIARCAETKFLRFADEITAYVRAQSKMTIALYSARMKVFAYCGMYDKACDLYGEIINDGLVPDSMMYGCLMKFSVECGRTDLSQAMFDKAWGHSVESQVLFLLLCSLCFLCCLASSCVGGTLFGDTELHVFDTRCGAGRRPRQSVLGVAEAQGVGRCSRHRSV